MELIRYLKIILSQKKYTSFWVVVKFYVAELLAGTTFRFSKTLKKASSFSSWSKIKLAPKFDNLRKWSNFSKLSFQLMIELELCRKELSLKNQRKYSVLFKNKVRPTKKQFRKIEESSQISVWNSVFPTAPRVKTITNIMTMVVLIGLIVVVILSKFRKEISNGIF